MRSFISKALSYSDLGMNDKALQMHESTLAMFRRILPEMHKSVETQLNNIALVSREEGRLADAKEFQERAVHIHLITLGENHPDYLNS